MTVAFKIELKMKENFLTIFMFENKFTKKEEIVFFIKILKTSKSKIIFLLFFLINHSYIKFSKCRTKTGLTK